MNKIDQIWFSSTVTSRGQTTVPKEIRDFFGIVEGTELLWIVRNGVALVEPRAGRLADSAGILGNPLGRTVSVEEMNQAVLDEAADRYGRSKP